MNGLFAANPALSQIQLGDGCLAFRLRRHFRTGAAHEYARLQILLDEIVLAAFRPQLQIVWRKPGLGGQLVLRVALDLGKYTSGTATGSRSKGIILCLALRQPPRYYSGHNRPNGFVVSLPYGT